MKARARMRKAEAHNGFTGIAIFGLIVGEAAWLSSTKSVAVPCVEIFEKARVQPVRSDAIKTVNPTNNITKKAEHKIVFLTFLSSLISSSLRQE